MKKWLLEYSWALYFGFILGFYDANAFTLQFWVTMLPVVVLLAVRDHYK